MAENGAPSISFVVFAYNQERFIRDAVEGALSQQCASMEIILSDDCSTDETFAIMQEMAKAYSGPHEVVVRRNEANLGLIDHINTVFQMARGEWVVVAAGDDISMPNRVAEIVRVIGEYPDINMVSSALCSIDESGNTNYVDHIFQSQMKSPLDHFVVSGMDEIIENNSPYAHGATLAYSRKLIESFPSLPANSVYEDDIFNFRSAILGRKAHINKPLVFYRSHSFQSTNLYSGKQHRIYSKKRRLVVGQLVSSEQKLADFCQNKCLLEDKLRASVKSILMQDLLIKKNQYRLFAWPWPLRVFPFVYLLASNPKYIFGMAKRDLVMVLIPSILSNFLIERRSSSRN